VHIFIKASESEVEAFEPPEGSVAAEFVQLNPEKLKSAASSKPGSHTPKRENDFETWMERVNALAPKICEPIGSEPFGGNRPIPVMEIVSCKNYSVTKSQRKFKPSSGGILGLPFLATPGNLTNPDDGRNWNSFYMSPQPKTCLFRDARIGAESGKTETCPSSLGFKMVERRFWGIESPRFIDWMSPATTSTFSLTRKSQLEKPLGLLWPAELSTQPDAKAVTPTSRKSLTWSDLKGKNLRFLVYSRYRLPKGGSKSIVLTSRSSWIGGESQDLVYFYFGTCAVTLGWFMLIAFQVTMRLTTPLHESGFDD